MKPTQENIKTWLVNQAWLVILVTLLTISLGIVLSEIQTKVGWLILIVSLFFVLITFASLTWIVVRHLYNISFGVAEQIYDTLEKYIGPDKISWLITTPQMARFEAKCKALEIWCISADLYEDIPSGEFSKTVNNNLKKGIKYTYFVPDTEQMHARMEQIVRFHNNSPNLGVKYVNDDFFFLVPKLDIIIYNPFGVGDTHRLGYLGIPTEADTQHFHARISSDFIDRLLGKLMKI
jgi:hypothetical protein